jgi:hypothetical protein
VAFLVGRGADLEARDTTWQATPLCWATVGSGFRLGHTPHPDWPATVRLLLAAGASTDGIWVAGKRPNDDVAALLHPYGIEPPAEDEEELG